LLYQVKSGYVMLDNVMSGQVRLGHVRSVMSGYFRLCQVVMLGLVMSG
jgi:hypothetical protein